MRTGLQGGRQRTFPLSLIRDSDRDGVGGRKRQQRQVAAEEEAYNRMYTVGTGRERDGNGSLGTIKPSASIVVF